MVPLMTGAVREMGLAAYAEAVYPRYHYGWSDLRSADVRPLQVHRGAAPGAVRPDAGSGRNAQSLRRAAGARRSHGGDPQPAATRMTRPRVRPAADVDPDTRARLAALGYVGTFVATPDRRPIAARGSEGQDRAVQPGHQSAGTDPRRSRLRGGLKTLREVDRARIRQVVDAWLMMGNEYSTPPRVLRARSTPFSARWR